jgi:hypothetical protein
MVDRLLAKLGDRETQLPLEPLDLMAAGGESATYTQQPKQERI